MKTCVKDWTRVPYGGEWHYIHPKTGVEIRARNRLLLIEKAKAHADANHLPIGLAFEDQVEECVCNDMPDECVPCKSSLPVVRRTLRLSDILRGTRTMLRHWANDGIVVEREVAERRAAICAKCPMNVKFSKPCSGLCPELKKLIESVVGAKGTPFDSRLKSCGICGCYLTASVWVPLHVQWSELDDEQKAAFAKMKEASGCWKCV